MLNIRKEDGFFRKGFAIRYITIWDDILNKRLGKDGPALFCKSPPGYLVHVELDSNNNVESKDIRIYFSTHNASDVIDRIIARQKEIVEICKTSIKLVFVLDVLDMRIIGRSDFTFYKPINGLSSLFILQEQEEDIFYMLVNPTVFKPEDIFSVFIAHLYSAMICLPPLSSVPKLFSKQFMQVISSMLYTKKGDIDFKVGTLDLLGSVNFNSLGQTSIKSLGRVDRLKLLTIASREQESKDLEKMIRKSGG